MRFCWTILPANMDYKKILLQDIPQKNAKLLKTAIVTSDISDELRTYLLRAIELNHCKGYSVFMSELVAGLSYAHKRRHVGILYKLRKTVSRNIHIERNIVDFFRNRLSMIDVNHDSWFKLRSLCMDVYTLARLLSDPYSTAIFYGGAQHARNVIEYFKDKGYKQVHTPQKITDISRELLLVQTYVFPADEKRTITFLGENHGKTTSEFAKNMINLLESECNVNQNHKTYFYVEKHIASKREQSVPAVLACNMDVAIHQVRCNPIIGKKCKGLKTICVDSRHYDLGFIRYELFEMTTEDAILYTHYKQFIEKVLQELQILLSPSKEL